MVVIKNHHSLDDVAYYRDKDNHQEQQRIGYTATIARHEKPPLKGY